MCPVGLQLTFFFIIDLSASYFLDLLINYLVHKLLDNSETTIKMFLKPIGHLQNAVLSDQKSKIQIYSIYKVIKKLPTSESESERERKLGILS